MATTVGTPAPLLLPAGSHKFEVITDMVEISVPLSGTYPEGLPVSGDFNLAPEEGVLLFGTLVEVLFAYKLYPALEPDHRFVIAGMEKNEGNLTIVGRIVKVEEE